MSEIEQNELEILVQEVQDYFDSPASNENNVVIDGHRRDESALDVTEDTVALWSTTLSGMPIFTLKEIEKYRQPSERNTNRQNSSVVSKIQRRLFKDKHIIYPRDHKFIQG